VMYIPNGIILDVLAVGVVFWELNH
jgi:predicted cation transporter